MSNRAAQAFMKGLTYARDVRAARDPLLVYVSGSPDSLNLGDNTLFRAYRQLFHRCSFARYGSGGAVLSGLSRIMRVTGHAVLGGGTLINRWGVGAAEEAIALFDNFFVFGTGVAQSGFWSGRPGWDDRMAKWKAVLKEADYLGVRGPLSAAALREAGLENAEVIGDPVLVYAHDSPQRDDSYRARCLGLNLGQAQGQVWGSEEQLVREYTRLAKQARESGWSVIWFVVHPDDREVTLHAATSSGTPEEVLEVYDDHTRFIESAARVSVFVGMKLHAVVLATCAYVPSVMVEYRPKCRDYMMLIDHEKSTVRTDRMRASEVWGMIEEYSIVRRRLSERLYDCIAPVRNRLQAKAEEIMAGL
jgi:hypothetical protein